MKFADFITKKAIRAELKAQTKEGVIEELVQALLDSGDVDADQREDIIASIMKREELGSTGIGRGVAVPHTKHPSVQKLVGTVGVSEGRRFTGYSLHYQVIVWVMDVLSGRPVSNFKVTHNRIAPVF